MSLLESVFNHLVLPPKVPGAHDPRYDDVFSDLVERLLDSVDHVAKCVPHQQKPELSILNQTLLTCKQLNSGSLEKSFLIKAFATIQERPLILYMEPQNAALILRLEAGARLVIVLLDSPTTILPLLQSGFVRMLME